MRVSFFVFVLPAVVAGGIASMAACQQERASDRVAGWRGDLDYLVAEARRVHASPARPAHSRAFTQAAASLSQRIPDLSDRRIVVELQRLLAMLGDGHSIVYAMPIPRASFSMLPVDLYLRHMDKAYWLHPLPENDALYFQFNQVADADTPLAAFASMLRDSLAATHAAHLIIDVRHNNGGNNFLLQPLVEAIAGFAAASPEHRVYVLTSRGTFSAAQNFINRIERRIPTTIFAGEPSMSSPNFTGEDNPVALPFSGLMVSISNRYWQDSNANDRRPWIVPQLPAALSSKDWLNNRDPVLDAVIRAIASSRRKNATEG